LLSAATIAAYSNALDGPFVFDDRLAITDNPRIRSLDPPWGPLATPRDTPVAGRPVVNLSLAINYALGGLDPRGYRAFNLGLHLACGLLLFGLVRRTLGVPGAAAGLRHDASGIATATALLWLVHPLGSECVDYATQRTESIMASFYLLTLYSVARVATASSPRADRAWSVVAVAAGALGGASKETMLTAPLVALLYDAIFHAGSVRVALNRRRWLYAGLGASMLVVVVTVLGAPRAHSVGASQGVSPWIYLANQSEMLVVYLQRVVWPDPLILDYGWPRPGSLTEWLPSLAFSAGFVSCVLILSWRHPALGFPALAGLIVLAPTSSVVPIVTEVGAERRMYLPLAGLLFLIVLAGHFALGRIRHRELRRTLAWVSVATLSVVLILVTRSRNEDYLDEATLWRESALARPANPRARLNLGDVLRRRGELDAADALFVEALTLHPPYGRAEAQRALVALTRGDLAVAEAHLRRALSLEPRLGDVRTNLGELLARAGRTDEALAEWREALARDPDLVFAANNLAWTLATHPDSRVRDAAEALRLAQHAADLSARSDPAILDTLAAAQAEAGRLPEASATAERAAGLAEALGDSELANAIHARARAYDEGRPHREPIDDATR
jgi:tetratricopeptide (TPR) repeat protein